MKKWWLMVALILLVGCNPLQKEEVVQEVKADSEEAVKKEGTSSEDYYQQQTHPAIVASLKEFDDLLDSYNQTIESSEYDPDYAQMVFTAMMEDYEELSLKIDELPVGGLDSDQSELNDFKVSAKMANDYRVKYAETLIEGLGDRGISREASEEAMEHLETSGNYSVESLEHVKAYESRKGY